MIWTHESPAIYAVELRNSIMEIGEEQMFPKDSKQTRVASAEVFCEEQMGFASPFSNRPPGVTQKANGDLPTLTRLL